MARSVMCCFAALAALVSVARGLHDGLALTPPMGFNTWNYFYCDINETVIRDTADLLVELGLKDAGYVHLNIDDCWSEKARDAQGRLHASAEKFPSGMKALADYVHSKGLKFGIYGDGGLLTCAGYPGSKGHEVIDAATFASWGVDYLKYDNCYAIPTDVHERYMAMRDALKATGRPIVYSMCEWGMDSPWAWASKVGHSWRVGADISPNWDTIMRSLSDVAGLARFAGPGGWNDPDMLEVGNGQLRENMERSHFALWALVKSPLLIGTDLRRIRPSSLNVLKAKEVIALNQDALGVAGDRLWKEGPVEIWAAPLSGGGRGVILFNRHFITPATTISVPFALLGYPLHEQLVVRNLYAERDLGVHSGSFRAVVAPLDVLALRVTPLGPGHVYEQWRPWHVAPNGRQTQRRPSVTV